MLYRNKSSWILPFVERKKVLDLGCVQHTAEKARNPDWLHGRIAQRAVSALGVDILQQDVDVLNARGYHVVCANVESMDLGDTFEVAVAGDLIEHLSNPGLFMEQVRRHLVPGGLFLITTPNPVTFMRFLQLLLTGRLAVNSEHTCWFTPQVLIELARRSGFRVAEVAYVDDTYQYYRERSKLWQGFLALNYWLCRMRPQLAETLCVALQSAGPIE